ncbi:glycosyltransferase [Acidipila rosea]|uniref:Cellulose synthase/poly-beta-1,6-N-acetylglucosamine synthase-like glycosyltransferase n=1 Tax=Acidipila rosea TaxID=768535 RepID=A0A4R1LB35_9BACT|nr:glycosyltransferase family 2 protein [Acidipila rosea]TCK75686.1 cellulose synthase/poly-beta-1,6-N-acetylglucosamine synthase-like glycosyltransferase [Acidipila rosea]
MEDSAATNPITLSVLVPARNEEASLGDCLASLTAQSEDGWQLGTDWELIVINDGSTDATRAIAAGYAGVTVLDAAAPPKGWTGKANALWTGTKVAQGAWLLFTDADTVHEPGNLRRALHEAEKYKAAMLSYSPRQIVSGFWQRALMPLVFSELALAYPPAKVSDPESRLAAANGQFLLVERDAYFKLGGHEAVAASVLEDVDLAFLFKRRKLGLRFRYAPDALSTRMYRSFGQMWEGWTKNLALLFANPLVLAAWRLLDLGLLILLPLLALYFAAPLSPATPWITARLVLLLIWARTLWRIYRRVARSHFPALDVALSIFGLPLFAVLLIRSWFHHTVKKRVIWKGRDYESRPR